MGLCSSPSIPDPGKAAVAGIEADTELSPFQYLLNAASTLGNKITIDGKEYDFTGQGQADVAATVSDKMAQTLLELQREKSPQIIAQRLKELEAADPQGFAARKQLFDRIMADAQNNPDRPVANELQGQLKNELSKGAGFSDAKQEEQVREGVRGQQVKSGIFLGEAPTSQEAKTVVNAGEQLRDQRQQNALALLQSGATPEETAFRRMQQSIGNLASFQNGQTPTAQFQQVSSGEGGPVSLTGGAPNTNFFDPNAGYRGVNNALSINSSRTAYENSQVNPWLAGLSIGANAWGTVNKIGNNA